MLAETVAQWRREAVEEGWRLGVAEAWERRLAESLRQAPSESLRQAMSKSLSRHRAQLRRMAAQQFGVATGDALAELLANEEDVERLAEVGDLVIGCRSAQELLERGRDMLDAGH